MKVVNIIVSLLILTFATNKLYASEIQASKGKVIKQGDQVFIEFQISWKLSWHNDINWDAAWVFAKDPKNGFKHLQLMSGSGKLIKNHSENQPVPDFDISRDALGAFIYRGEKTSKRGTNNWTVQIEWDYRTSEYSIDELPEIVEIYAIEMVYVPEGPFEAGDPDGINGPSNTFFSVNKDSIGTYTVENSNRIEICSGKGSLCYNSGGGDQKGPIPDAYPNGYDAFYLMKYKVTQGQYVNFLNAISTTQAANRGIHAAGEYKSVRGSITIINGNYLAEHPDWACGFLGWADGAAFADWAALRPYTELEYEKAARGPINAVTNEYAWGSKKIVHGDSIFEASGILAITENGDEFIRGNANFKPDSVDFGNKKSMAFKGGEGMFGPVRVDVFESRAYTFDEPNKREASGAGYYGALGLTGGLFERVISTGSERGRLFTGSHGDGQISYSGLARNMVEDWPDRLGQGLALRARNYAFDTRSLQMANRGFGSYPAYYRASGMGFRAARTAEIGTNK